MERGRIQWLPKFFAYPQLSQERVKLRTSNLASTFTGPIRIKAHKSFGENGAWAYPGAAKSFRVPSIISGTGKATDFKFCRTIHRVDRNNYGNRSRRRSQGAPKIFRSPTYGAHCAVFAIAQLSHEVPHWLYISKFTRLRAVSWRQHGSCLS